MAWYLRTPSHYLNQCRLILIEINIMICTYEEMVLFLITNVCKNYIFKTSYFYQGPISPGTHCQHTALVVNVSDIIQLTHLRSFFSKAQDIVLSDRRCIFYFSILFFYKLEHLNHLIDCNYFNLLIILLRIILACDRVGLPRGVYCDCTCTLESRLLGQHKLTHGCLGTWTISLEIYTFTMCISLEFWV